MRKSRQNLHVSEDLNLFKPGRFFSFYLFISSVFFLMLRQFCTRQYVSVEWKSYIFGPVFCPPFYSIYFLKYISLTIRVIGKKMFLSTDK